MQRGFTLIELLVVISIFAIAAAAVLLNYRTGQEELALQRAASKLAQDIRRAQEMAMSSREFCLSPPCPPNPKEVPQGGYGIYLSELGSFQYEYRIYADRDSPSSPQAAWRSPSGAEDIETIFLEKGVKIYDISTSSNHVSINFRPPDPTIRIRFNPGAPPNEVDEVVITLALQSNPSIQKTVTFNKTGLIKLD